MSKIDELIQEYCPDGVEFLQLKECTKMLRGTSLSKKNANDGPYPVISGGREPAFYCNAYNRNNENITVAGSGAGAGFVQYWNQPIFVCDAFSVSGRENVLTKYVYYYLSSIQDKIYATKTNGGIPHVHISSIESFEIPVSPLPVQQEIVRILDSFTALQDELQKELEERKKQFEHVRDQLMNNGSDVILSDVAEYSKGRVSASEMTTENYVGVDNLLQNKAGKVSATFVPAKGNVIRFERNDILIGNIRPYLKKIWLADTNGGTNGDVLCIHVLDSSSVNPRYLYFVLSSDAFFAYDTVNVRSSGKMPRGDKESVMKYSFTLPSLQEQNDIVRKLESMSEYIYDAIPEELSLRQQQYTYYRDKLLSFPRKEA